MGPGEGSSTCLPHVRRRAAAAALVVFGLFAGALAVPADAEAASEVALTLLPGETPSDLRGEAPAYVPGEAPAYVPGELVVRYRAGAATAARETLRAQVGVHAARPAGLPDAEVLLLPDGVDVEAAAAALGRRPEVAYAEPNYLFPIAAPNDPHFGLQWGLRNRGQSIQGSSGVPGADIDAIEAWRLSTGSAAVVVAVVDTGIEPSHPDLAANIDSRSWDFVDGRGTLTDPHGHGTHVAGIVGAVGNNRTGVSGVAWAVRIMALRALGADGWGSSSDIVSAFSYAVDQGAHVVNASIGGAVSSQHMREFFASDAARRALFVVAAGNDGRNNDRTPTYPCNYGIELRLETLVCVAASDQDDRLAEFAPPRGSNWGPTAVHLAAPGRRVVSTWPGRSYAYLSGTSMAAPHVAGVAALVRSARPGVPVAGLREILLGSVDERRALAGKVSTGGRVNAANALAVPRVAGSDRIATAVAASRVSFAPGGARAVVLARADDFPDALAGTPLAVAERGPLLLTGRGALDARTERELRRALPRIRTVYLLGGTGALAEAVETRVRLLGYTVVRLAGDDRYETAVAVARRLVGGRRDAPVLLATGTGFADAVAAGAAAAREGGAIVLTAGRTLPAATAGFLAERDGPLYAVGGAAAAAAPIAERIAGPDRYETAILLAQRFWGSSRGMVGIASGGSFPDALAGGAHAGAAGVPLLLSRRTSVPRAVADYLETRQPSRASLYGGPSALSTGVRSATRQIVLGG